MHRVALAVLTIGLSGIIAQVLVLRELLVSFCGNELTLGIILANWVFSEALGVYIIGKYVDRAKPVLIHQVKVFIYLELAFSLLLPLAIYLCRLSKTIAGIPYGEGAGLPVIFLASLFIILPLGFCHGALFGSSCKIHSLSAQDTSGSIGRVYALEIVGTVLGSLCLAYILLPYFNSFAIVFLVSLINIILCLSFLKELKDSRIKYLVGAFLVAWEFFFFSGSIGRAQRASLASQWGNRELIDYHNSPYGNIAVTKESGQRTFFYNGLPVITVPYPDKQFSEEFAHLPLLFHGPAREVLVIGSGAGGLIHELLKHPIKSLDYAELDPLLIDMVKKHGTVLTAEELADKRVYIANSDGRAFLRARGKLYDVILVGLSNPSDLSTNRLFTRQFFALAKMRLREGGLLALWLPGSLSYLNRELISLNTSVLGALRKEFPHVRIIPGDYNIYLASFSQNIITLNPDEISKRLSGLGIKTAILVPDYISYRLDKKWLKWFSKETSGAALQVNEDLRPAAVFDMLIYWNRKLSPSFIPLLEFFKNINLWVIAAFIGILTVLLYVFGRNAKTVIAYSIATSGFFGMLATLVLVFSFQVFFGYLYHRIGMLIAIFMAGASLGGIFAARFSHGLKKRFNWFMGIELLIIVFSSVLTLIAYGGSLPLQSLSMLFNLLFFLSGSLIGLEFPLAGVILNPGNKTGHTAGILYGADLMGGWLAGILGGIILLPVLGLLNTCMVMVLFKLSSLVLLCSLRENF